MSDLLVRGSPKEQASTESIAWQFDWSARLGVQTISSATVTVTRLDTGADVTASVVTGSVSTTTTTTSVTIHALTAGKRFRVAVLATFSGGSQQMAVLELMTPY